MKKSVVLAVVAIAFACLVFPQTVSAVTVSNSSFEATGGWVAAGGGTFNDWMPRTGSQAITLWGWDPTSSYSIYQDVPVPGGGEYTFSIFTLMEQNLNATSIELSMEFRDGGGNVLEPATVVDFTDIAKDNLWHQLHMTADAPQTVGYIRVRVDIEWNGTPGTDLQAVYFDDVELYAGSYTGVTEFSNSSFDVGGSGWGGSQWTASPKSDCTIVDWAGAPQSGSRVAVFEGWAWVDQGVTNTRHDIVRRVSQPMTMLGTGTYSFVVWARREAEFALDDFQLRIEWLDESFNEVQAASVTNIDIPADNQWRQYYIIGTCTNTNVFEIRPVVQVQYDRATTGGDRCLFLDSTRFIAGTYSGSAINMDWAYHAAVGLDPALEMIPGDGGLGAFVQINNTTRTNTFYVLTDADGLAVFAGETGSVHLRTSWEKPGVGWETTNLPMNLVGTIEIPENDFRGLPVSGTKTVDLWRCDSAQPADAEGAPYPDPITIYYAPYIVTMDGSTETDRRYLVGQGLTTNNLGQAYGTDCMYVDYSLVNFSNPPTQLAFANGDFRYPVETNTMTDSGWSSLGGMTREDWADRTGAVSNRALVFHSWDAGREQAFQDIATTGGIYHFSTYVKIENGVTNLPRLSMVLEWYNQDGVLVQADEHSLKDSPYDQWTYASMIALCNEPDLAFVRVALVGEFGPSEGVAKATMFDDMAFAQLTSSLQNPSFEETTNTGNFVSGWYGSGNALREEWGGRTGSRLLAFHTWSTGSANVYQDILTSGGAYKFSAWAMTEIGATNISDLNLKMEWFTLDGSCVQTNEQSLLSLPRGSNYWEEVYVVGACYADNLARVRISITGAWGDSHYPSEEKTTKFDDVQFAAVGSTLQNGGFELGDAHDTPSWYSKSKQLMRIETWAGHSGAQGVAFRGWERNDFFTGRYENTLEQPVVVTPGAYEFSIWLARDVAMTLTNAELRIEWYGNDYPNKIQADTVLPLTLPADAAWYQYTVQGECSSSQVKFAKPVLFCQWNAFANDSVKIDDAVFQSTGGSSETDGIPNTWWDAYSIAPEDRVAADDADGDGFTNWEEYVADTDPTSVGASFPEMAKPAGVGVLSFTIDPTSTDRVYDLFWRTNLVDAAEQWTPCGLNVAGDGGEISLTVTNDGPRRFYRTGVMLP